MTNKVEKVIELHSVKLPYIPLDLIKKTNGENLTDAVIRVEGSINEPTHTILMTGLLSKHVYHPSKCVLRKRPTQYRIEKALTNPPIDITALYHDILREANNISLISVNVKFISLTFNINGVIYRFNYHSPNRANVLKSIDGKPIGKMTVTKRNKLLMGDLAFSAPSDCKLVYSKPEWIC